MAAAASTGMDALYSKMNVPSSNLNVGSSVGYNTALGTTGVLGSNLFASVITKIKENKDTSRRNEIVNQEVNALLSPKTLEEADNNISKLSRLLEDTITQNSEISGRLILAKAELAEIESRHRGTPANAIPDENSRRQLQQKRNAEKQPYIEKIDAINSELIPIQATVENIILKADENKRFIKEKKSKGSILHNVTHSISEPISSAKSAAKSAWEFNIFDSGKKGGTYKNKFRKYRRNNLTRKSKYSVTHRKKYYRKLKNKKYSTKHRNKK